MLIRGRTLQVPILQGGMGVGVSLGGLAGAVAAQGALGCISTADTGFREPDFEKDPNGANLRALTKEIEKARQIARVKVDETGVEAAAEVHFGTSAAKLTRRQACLIAASLPNPLRRNPAKPSSYLFRRAGDIAAAVGFLADDKASFITGQVLTADGGFIL